MRVMQRKGAVELSVGTIVILVIGMTMLVLGILLVRTIFSTATESVELIDEGVKNEINELFSSDSSKKVVVNLPDNEVDVKKGEGFGISFGIRNLVEDTESTDFKYVISVPGQGNIERGCNLDPERANQYLKLNYELDRINIEAGKTKAFFVRVEPSNSAPLCSISYQIKVEYYDGTTLKSYDTEQFTINIVAD